MNNQITIIAAIAGIASLLAQGMAAIASGGYSVSSEVHQIRADISLIRKDLKAQNQLLEYRLTELEKKGGK